MIWYTIPIFRRVAVERAVGPFMQKKAAKTKKDRQLLSMVLLIGILAVILVAFFVRYYQLERQGCVTRLEEHTQTAGSQIMATVDRSRSYLNKISNIVYARCMLSEADGRSILESLEDMDLISRLELILPDGTLYTSSGIRKDPTLSYKKLLESEDGGATRRALDQLSPDQQIIRLYAPVLKGGRTVAIISGVIPMDRLSSHFTVAAYDHQAKLFLMESETGNYLIDPDHDRPGNLRDVENYLFTSGYSKEQFYREVRTGESGFTVMRSPNANDNDYFCYSSVGFQDWVVMLSVKENIAFAQSETVMVLFIIMIGLVSGLSMAFLLWFFRDLRRRQARTELQLRGGTYMLEVQQTLFRAHIDPGAFEQALLEIANYLTADAVAYYTLSADGSLLLQDVAGSTTKVPPKKADFQSFFPQTAKSLLASGRFFSNRPFLWGDEDWRSAREIGIRNMMLVRIDSLDGKDPLGMLCAVNPDVLWNSTEPLDQVSLTFTMAVENRQNYQTLAYISQVDELTGLMNRNSYHARLDTLTAMEGGTVGCVYIDANGLHEINNHLGHDAGDEMLRSVADALLASFDKKDIFRLGGDEFAVLVTAMSQEDLDRKAKAVGEAVEKCGYTVSVGVEWRRGEFQVSAIVAAAEAAMRKNKAEFYASKGGERQMRNLNTRLEQTLSAKRDADTLLSYLAPNLLGVYFVDPEKDACRSIIAPPYFDQALKETQYRFHAAMELYISQQVRPDDQALLRQCCDYDYILPLLQKEGPQERRFRKNDGTEVILKVRHPSRSGDNTAELIWLFQMAG